MRCVFFKRQNLTVRCGSVEAHRNASYRTAPHRTVRKNRTVKILDQHAGGGVATVRLATNVAFNLGRTFFFFFF